MFEQTFKNIDDVLWKEAGCSSELDYTEQTSWMLFLKYLDDLETERSLEAELTGKKYTSIIDPEYQWSAWAAPKKADGSFDHDTALIGDDLIDFVNTKLFPYLKGFKQRASSVDTIEYKIGEIFSEISYLFVQLGISRKGYVFLLYSAVYQYFPFLSPLAVQLNGYLQDFLNSLLTDPFSEVDKVCRVTGKIPFKFSLPAEILVVAIFHPALHN